MIHDLQNVNKDYFYFGIATFKCLYFKCQITFCEVVEIFLCPINYGVWFAFQCES